MCTCSAASLDNDLFGKYDEEENDLKVYSEKFKNKRIILTPPKKKKADFLDGDEDEEETPKRNGRKPIGRHFVALLQFLATKFYFLLLTSLLSVTPTSKRWS